MKNFRKLFLVPLDHLSGYNHFTVEAMYVFLELKKIAMGVI